jgi:hypothetical protein
MLAITPGWLVGSFRIRPLNWIGPSIRLSLASPGDLDEFNILIPSLKVAAPWNATRQARSVRAP